MDEFAMAVGFVVGTCVVAGLACWMSAVRRGLDTYRIELLERQLHIRELYNPSPYKQEHLKEQVRELVRSYNVHSAGLHCWLTERHGPYAQSALVLHFDGSAPKP